MDNIELDEILNNSNKIYIYAVSHCISTSKGNFYEMLQDTATISVI